MSERRFANRSTLADQRKRVKSDGHLIASMR